MSLAHLAHFPFGCVSQRPTQRRSIQNVQTICRRPIYLLRKLTLPCMFWPFSYGLGGNNRSLCSAKTHPLSKSQVPPTWSGSSPLPYPQYWDAILNSWRHAKPPLSNGRCPKNSTTCFVQCQMGQCNVSNGTILSGQRPISPLLGCRSDEYPQFPLRRLQVIKYGDTITVEVW